MKKIAKIFLIIFVAVNIGGGSVLGVHDYLKDKEYKDAYNQYNAMVKGAYVSKDAGGPTFLEDAVAAVAAITIGSVTYSLLLRRRIKNKHTLKTPKRL